MIKIHNFNPECITYSQMNMIFTAKIYYRRLANLTRLYISSRYYDLGAEDALFNRLYLEYIDIGNMMRLNFGRAYSEQYKQLLGQFIVDLRDLISAHIEGNMEEVNIYIERLYQNTNERAALLSAMNPYWSEADYINLFGAYIRFIIEEANAVATGNFNEDIRLGDRLTVLTDRMGNVFAEGVYSYITSGSQNTNNLPAEQSGRCINYEQMIAIQNIRLFRFDRMIWLERYMRSRYSGLGNPEEIYNRLMQVSVDYTNELKKMYGEKFAADLLQELIVYLNLIDDLITAQMEGNIDEINRIIPLLFQNADNRAALQASVNPFFSENEWRNRLYNNVRGVIDESAAFSSGDSVKYFDIFISLLDQAESMGDYQAEVLFNYFTNIQQNQK